MTSEIYSTPFEVEGRCLQDAIVQAFVSDGEIITKLNVAYLRIDGAWFRLALDSGTIHWRPLAEVPSPWAVEEEGWSYPHTNLSQQLELPAVVDRLSINSSGQKVQVVFFLASDRQLFLEEEDARTSYRVG